MWRKSIRRQCFLFWMIYFLTVSLAQQATTDTMENVDSVTLRHDEIVDELIRMTRGDVDRDTISHMIANATHCPLGELSPSCYNALQTTVIEPLRSYRAALIVVDFQNDFVSGSLALKNGEAGQDPLEAVAPLNALLESNKMDLVVYTKDWHPPNHISFYEHCRNQDRQLSCADQKRKLKPFDLVQFVKPTNTSQVLYPTHCVQETWGAEIDPKIVIHPKAKYVEKGTDVYVDSYSAFFDNQKKSKTILEETLRSDGISVVLACGLAYDICVAATLKDAADIGFLSAVITDCSKGLVQEGIDHANDAFNKKKVAILNSDQADSIFKHQYIPVEWVETLLGRLPNSL